MKYSKEDLQRKLKSELVRIAGQELRIFSGKRDRRGNIITNQSAYAASIPHEELVKDILAFQAKQDAKGGDGPDEGKGGEGREGKAESEGKGESDTDNAAEAEADADAESEGKGEGQQDGGTEGKGNESEGKDGDKGEAKSGGEAEAESSDAGKTLWQIIKPEAYKDIKGDLQRLNRKAVQDAVNRILPKTITVKIVLPDGEQKKLDRVHKTFPKLLRYAQKGENGFRPNIMLVGPAGSFKSHAAGQLAEALNLPFYQVSIGPQTSESKLVGFVDAHGRDVATQVRKAYATGGVILIDEIDAGNPGVLTCLNSITSNGRASFLGEMVERHPDCIVVGTANTFGRGADRVYVGRQALDGATLDRWVQVVWDYDEELEKALWVNSQPALRWFEFVGRVRAGVFALGLRVIVSPRCTQQGTHLLSVGVEWADVEQDVVWNRFSTDDRTKVQQWLRDNPARKAA